MHIHTSNQRQLNLGYGDYTCNWGVHIAGLYETEQERDEIIFGFLHEGDLQKELQLYCPVERTIADFNDSYQKKFPDCSANVNDKNRFSLSSAKDLYYPDGVFSPSKMDLYLNAFFENSQKNGKRNIRATAEMVWALEAIPGIEHLMAYESRLNYFIAGKPWISICLYNLSKFNGKTIMKVLQTHPYTISNGVITENPYYENPDKWLKTNAPQFLNDLPDSTK
ncbi:MAG: MEDS domain-containing protein [Melioribacteraceae bacterium]|nr:MEDS domain-containing protein [Melioribacteraceae bacterium]MCF8263716.1 MEDS domain-containing protein [Melioribacteraceae bacterium]MCF8431747.1 MEDS domain-containing protein [Melioribacteraceae bacterium]